jgi:ankyrin repeat protein
MSVVQALLRSGADVTVTNASGETPLNLACRHGNMDIVKALLASDANVTVTNASGWTPLHLACLKGHTDAVQALLANDAGPCIRVVTLTSAPLSRSALTISV